MIKFLVTVSVVSLLSNLTFADDLGRKIASCLTSGQNGSSSELIQVFRKGNDRNDKNALTVHFKSAQADKLFPVGEMAWQNNGNTLALRFANFILVWIHNGISTDSKVGVALGAPPQNMTCHANL